MGACYHHLTWTDRLRIEAYLKAGLNKKAIAKEIGVSFVTIYAEIKRGRYTHLNSDYTQEIRYSPDIAEARYRENLTGKGAPLKIGKDHALANYLEHKICDEHYSPDAALGEIKAQKLQFATSICKTTLYSYIDKGIFLRLTNKDLPYKSQKKNHPRRVRAVRAPRGSSIEQRSSEIDNRSTFGHWEMDCVIGQKGTKPVLLVLTERKTRCEHIIPMRDKSAESVVHSLDRLERRYGSRFYDLFKTITVDNGSEFADCAGIEKACRRNGKRTKVYYCHPYTSCERGSNENQNRIIRRFIPKGTNIGKLSRSYIQQVEDWINNYPRKLFAYASAGALFRQELDALA